MDVRTSSLGFEYFVLLYFEYINNQKRTAGDDSKIGIIELKILIS